MNQVSAEGHSQGSTGQNKSSPIIDPPNTWGDRWARTISDYCSPILLKAVRQNIKSRTFLISFNLLLVCCVFWTIACFIISSNYANLLNSKQLLFGYSLILGVPLIIIVPLISYEAISSTFRDNTFDLLSITTATSRSIIYGVFSSSVLQSLLYFGGVLPCIAFCMILDGTDIRAITLIITSCFASSLVLNGAGIAVACLCSGRVAMVVGRLMFALFCILCMFYWGAFAYSNTSFFNELDFIQLPTFVLYYLIGLSFLILFLESSISLIGFNSENRSTVTRLVMHLPLLAIWMTGVDTAFRYASVSSFDDFFWGVIVMQFWGSHYLLIAGSMCCAENHELSKRVRRSLPKSELSKSISCLLFPGIHRGFLYSLVSLLIWNLSLAIFPLILYFFAGMTDIIMFDWNVIANQYSFTSLFYSAALNFLIASIILSLVYLLNRLVFVTVGNGRVVNSLIFLLIIYFTYQLGYLILRSAYSRITGNYLESSEIFVGSWWGVFESVSGSSYDYFGVSWVYISVLGFHVVVFLALCYRCIAEACFYLEATPPKPKKEG